jgi:hypothetical protein
LVSEATVIGDTAPDAVWVTPPPLEVHVAVNAVMVSPPLPLAVNATIAELLPRVTPVTVGAGGVVAATNEADAVDAALLPKAFVASTVQVYVLLLLREATVIGEEAPDADCVVPPSLDAQVAVKPVIALPPLPFAVNATIAVLFPRVTPVTLGATGTVPATNEVEAADALLSPKLFVATTVQLYVLLLVREATLIGEDAPDTVCVAPPSLDVQVALYAVMVSPLLPFAANATVTELLPRVTPVTLGAGGLVAATNELDVAEAALSPTPLVATAVHV